MAIFPIFADGGRGRGRDRSWLNADFTVFSSLQAFFTRLWHYYSVGMMVALLFGWLTGFRQARGGRRLPILVLQVMALSGIPYNTASYVRLGLKSVIFFL